MTIFSSVDDLRLHWPDAPDDDGLLEQKLEEASIEVIANFPSVESRVASGRLDPRIPVLVVNRMVRRALEDTGLPAGVSTVQSTAGPFNQSVTFGNANDGNIFLSSAEKKMLGSGAKGRPKTIRLRGGF